MGSRRADLYLTSAVLAIAALMLPGTGRSHAAQAGDEFRWAGRIAAGDAIEIKAANGPLFAEYTSGDQVEVVAIKEGPREDRDVVRFEVVEHSGGVTICAIYPSRGDRENECGPGDEGRIGSHDNETETEFTARVPAGVRFVGKTMNGRVQADGLRGDVDLVTMNGDIEASASGTVSARTMNGAVEVSMGRADWTGDLEIESMNGAITVELPDDASAEVRAETMNGRIHSDWDLEVSGWLKNRARGTIGGGGRRLDIRTMNGSIRIRRAG